MDIELFLVSRQVEESLEKRESGPCLAWCYENKSKLRKLKVQKDEEILDVCLFFHLAQNFLTLD